MVQGPAKDVRLSRNVCDFCQRDDDDYWLMFRRIGGDKRFSVGVIPWVLTTIYQMPQRLSLKVAFLMPLFLWVRSLDPASLLSADGSHGEVKPGPAFITGFSQGMLSL